MKITKAAVLITAMLLAAVVMPLWAFGQTADPVGADRSEDAEQTVGTDQAEDANQTDETDWSDGADWDALQEKYLRDDAVQDLIFVKYEGNAKATLYLYEKDEENNWEETLCCLAYTGGNGIDKEREGDRRTPTGDFPITHAFGIQDDPGSQMEYLKVNNNHYWCGDKEHYNQLVDISKDWHSCRGEHLIDYTKQYAYAMNIGYNTEGTYGKGSAIFLHCFGYCEYTLGCVSVAEENMIKLLQRCGEGTRICIYKE